jgi:mRNA-degrading endonuclease toxin of MazEF toxin-antitoxin module
MLRQGSIAWVNLCDQAGRNPKCRPAIVITPTEEIDAAKRLTLVAAVGTFSQPLPANRIALPWRKGRHPITGLYKKCIAVCDWIVAVDKSAIVSVGGVCPHEIMSRILNQIPP